MWRFLPLILVANLSDRATAQTSPLADAPTTSEKVRLIPWRGIVQFRGGELLRIESSGQTSPLGFADPIYEGERIELRTGGIAAGAPMAAAKFKTREGCVLAVYAKNQAAVLLPPDGEKPWRLHAEAVRAVCPVGSALTFSFRGAILSLGRASAAISEVFVDDQRALAVRGAVHAVSLPTKSLAPLNAKTLYHFDLGKKSWIEESTKAKDLYRFHLGRPLLAESERLQAPDETISTRFIFGPGFGATSFVFDNETLNSLGQDNEGARAQLQFKWDDRSLIAMFLFRNTESHSSGSPPPDSARVRSDFVGAEFGVRLRHEAWWSPFVRVGIGREQPKIEVYYPSAGVFLYDKYEFYALSLAAGIDALYSPQWLNWLGLYGSLELHATQSLGRGAREAQNQTSQSNPAVKASQEPWRLTAIGLIGHLGLMFQF